MSRRSGADGRVQIDYATKDGSAVGGKHFVSQKGTLVFQSGEMRQVIKVHMLPFDTSGMWEVQSMDTQQHVIDHLSVRRSTLSFTFGAILW